MSEILLSICIPTYNRYFYLKRLLDSILPQLVCVKEKIEVIISDNASSDETIHLCDEYAREYSFFRYSQNSKNEGPDYNIHNVFNCATGRYVWVIGDDEIVIENAIKNIIFLLDKHQPNFIFLNNIGNLNCTINHPSSNPVKYLVTDNSERFSKLIGVYVTFISGCIINKSILDINSDHKKLIGSYLVQLSWVLPSLSHRGVHIFVQTPLIIAQQDNSGGYKYVTVFAINFLDIIRSYYKDGSAMYNSFSLSTLLHLYQFQYKTAMSNYEYENSDSLMKKAFSSSYLYKYILFPFGKIKFVYFLIRNTIRIRQFYLKLFFRKMKVCIIS
ncbi:glycosyltransferase family 2 protein [Leminorella grimontii]|uniref:glycosyltransferase family 2 protein n=1 Tax=Leminorella grimontii TaxID=82981 RepID=UPI0032209DC1